MLLYVINVWLDGKPIQTILTVEDGPAIVSASIQDPYIAIKRNDSSVQLFLGDSATRSILETKITPDSVCEVVQLLEES
jgi:hypothetical protein